MALDQDRADELFAAFGPVQVKRMFGGVGVFVDGLMIALEARGALFLKSDDGTAPLFEAEGCESFDVPRAGGRRIALPYRRAPERLLDDVDEMAEWARRSLAIARARPAAKRKRKTASAD